LTRREDWEAAISRLHATNNFPEWTGRLCPAPCESACVLGINQPAVTIKNIEQSIADTAWDEGLVTPQVPERQTGRTVAVVGSGPAGLAAAQQLTRAGHTVAVLERDDRIGGLLTYGIPDFKMEKVQVTRRLAQMEAEGTIFRTGVDVGRTVTGQELLERYDAVVLATGATVPREVPVPGRELGGVELAMDYLVQSNRATAGDEVPDQVLATGKDVVVIGGGDTGSDCFGTAKRQGARSVTQVDINIRRPDERAPGEPGGAGGGGDAGSVCFGPARRRGARAVAQGDIDTRRPGARAPGEPCRRDPRVFPVSPPHEGGGGRVFGSATPGLLPDGS